MMNKEFLPLAKPYITEEEEKQVLAVIRSGWWTTGTKTRQFEKELADYLSHENPVHCLALDSCTSALHLALLALNIGPGDEVIVPTWTFVATAHVVEWVGAKLVLCDIEEDSLNMDVDNAESCVTDKTKAIMPVHMAGYPCNINKIGKLAQKYQLKVIEDAAHAIGTKYHDIKIGNFADVTCFSFYATKNLAMGEGGAAVSQNPEAIETMKKLAYFGINNDAFKRYEKSGSWHYDIEEQGYKCNLSDLHAALGLAQLKKLDWMNDRRRQIAKIYKEKLSDKIQFTQDSGEHYHSYHLFPIFLPDGIKRNDFMDELKSHNIGSSVHFIPLHLHSYYEKQFDKEQFPVANRVHEKLVSIPMFPSMTDEDVDYVVYHVNRMIG